MFRNSGLDPTTRPTALRVASVAIAIAPFETVLDLCTAAEKRWARNGNSSPLLLAALMVIDLEIFEGGLPANIPMIGPLTTNYPMLVRSLRALKITHSRFDESAALGAFAAVATTAPHLWELNIRGCGLTSVRGLAGRCEYLRKVDLYGCCQLNSLDGLEGRLFLEYVNVSGAAITSVEPLLTCPALKKVDLSGCRNLTALQGLENHQFLEEVDASWTMITSIEPLRTCPALTKVGIIGCDVRTAAVNLSPHVKVVREVEAYTQAFSF